MRRRTCRAPPLMLLLFVLLALAAVGRPQQAVPSNNFWIARLRHQRHLDNSPRAEQHIADENSYSNSNPYQVRGSSPKTLLTVQDNHKPVFTNCLNYQPVVKEEQLANTYVFTVKAFDKDPPDNGGTITYTLVSSNERPKFSIDAQTGAITTLSMFDRDEPDRIKEMYLTVRATDNGKPHLDDVCTFKVTVQDLNDNTPVFDRVVYRGFSYKSYVESVPRDLAPGSEVMRISATDIDDGDNSAVEYGLSPRVLQDSNYFTIDRTTGVIFLAENRTIDKEPGYKYKMQATATDKGVPPLSTMMDLEIVVVESHKKAPSFTSVQPQGVIYLPENLSNIATTLSH